MNLGFCVEGEYQFPCKTFTFYEFPDEKDVIVLILEYFKRFVPELCRNRTDYYGNPIVVDPKDVGLVVQQEYGNYVVVISIVDDNSTYPDESFQLERTEYVFQVDLQVQADNALASLENLLKLKSVVKTLLVSMDKNLQLFCIPDTFSYGDFGTDEANNPVRQGTYRFFIRQDNYRK